MAPMAKPVALTAQKAEVLEASAGRGMQSLTRQEMGHRQQLLSRAQQQRTSYCWTCQVCCPPRLSVGSSTSRGHAGSSGRRCKPMGQPGGCPTSLAQPDALCWQLAGFVCVRISACTKHLQEDMCSRCGCLCCDAQARTSSSLHSSLVLLVLLATFEIMLRLCCNMH